MAGPEIRLGYLNRSRNTPDISNTVAPEDLAGDAGNYGFADETAGPRGSTEKRGRRVPHPDDPPQRVEGPIGGIGQSVDLPRREGVPQGDLYDRLRGLKTLLDEGHITEEEHAAKKAELLKLL